MKIPFFIAFFALVLGVLAWSAQDHEIFRINHELEQKFGKGIDFYKFLKLPHGSSSNNKEISKQVKKLSVKWHPDKFKTKQEKKKATIYFEYINIIANVLKSEQKDRYDFFLKTGFPKYKNNRFLYERFRPGLLFVLCFLFVIVAICHYVILRIQSSQDKKKVQQLIDEIKQCAQKDAGGKDGIFTEQKKVYLESLNKYFLVRIDGVFIIDENDETNLYKLSPDDIETPTLKDTILVKLLVYCWNTTVGKISESSIIELNKQVEKKAIKDNFNSKNSNANKKKPTGTKKVLPNGKVIYSRK